MIITLCEYLRTQITNQTKSEKSKPVKPSTIKKSEQRR